MNIVDQSSKHRNKLAKEGYFTRLFGHVFQMGVFEGCSPLQKAGDPSERSPERSPDGE